MKLKIGDNYKEEFVITQDMVNKFAELSGDKNPLHLDKEFASQTMFRERIAHGMWSGSLVSATLATVMPGPGTIYLNQSLNFLRPVKLGDTLKVTLSATEKNDEKKTVLFKCRVENQKEEAVVKGDALVIAPTEKISLNKPTLPDIHIG